MGARTDDDCARLDQTPDGTAATAAFTDPLLQLPLAMLSAAVPVVMLTRYGLLAGVPLLASPAIVGFYVTIAGRSLVGRRFELSET